MRGDRPGFGDGDMQRTKFTPHARGSTTLSLLAHQAPKVYPACAGIDRTRGLDVFVIWGLPRMRGDRPFRRINPRTSY